MVHELPVQFAGVRGNAVLLAQKFLGEILREGSVAVDATAGNGKDTLFLAGAVGNSGKVYAFDIQREALESTAILLKESGLDQRVELIHAGHEHMERYINRPVDGFIFNLGYLPGGDHGITTRPETTLQAVNAAFNLLKPGGRISMVVYTGHRGAGEESRAVEQMAAGLNPKLFGALKVSFLNRPASAPYLVLIERVKQ
ncbi:class I SAM-dependent methyltransferase [Desulfallas sp. Bu1-1]|jgi:tRNA1(Val) A37 N6-methylase TrmN6|uniref:tRNA (mnm(5)s(2)U34)-methyltransferase n=1 Tax=Desulfallas sp. Bu1-1 TaxID=2787620 RepID=UPI0018A07E6E|nr:class I SAM-dependent methyltransferase [Desulfallas sp. Bu1-1]MBF7082082.1 class I SAM-dependent methyltransferase [Desulfallas sp. Bu1-1]